MYRGLAIRNFALKSRKSCEDKNFENLEKVFDISLIYRKGYLYKIKILIHLTGQGYGKQYVSSYQHIHNGILMYIVII
jgi:hypothetical protein